MDKDPCRVCWRMYDSSSLCWRLAQGSRPPEGIAYFLGPQNAGPEARIGSFGSKAQGLLDRVVRSRNWLY